ncbi:MAG: RNase III inhibitor, partial [Synergistales bacterium]|nr:RNase III inhibitor [Synergistales bacterium]
ETIRAFLETDDKLERVYLVAFGDEVTNRYRELGI